MGEGGREDCRHRKSGNGEHAATNLQGDKREKMGLEWPFETPSPLDRRLEGKLFEEIKRPDRSDHKWICRLRLMLLLSSVSVVFVVVLFQLSGAWPRISLHQRFEEWAKDRQQQQRMEKKISHEDALYTAAAAVDVVAVVVLLAVVGDEQ